MKVSEEGNLIVLNGHNEVLWSTNVSDEVRNPVAYLTNDGSLVLRDNTSDNNIWESFQQPSNILVRNMILTANVRTGENTFLRSWKNASDPSIGSFTGGINPLEIPEVFIWNGTRPYWRSGPWNGQIFLGVPDMYSVYFYGFSLIGNQNKSFSLSFTYSDESPLYNYVLSPDGELSEAYWVNETQSWANSWRVPNSECDIYGLCGPFGVCNAQNSPICTCLRGFEPKNADEWRKGNWTDGCIRRRSLQCERNENSGKIGTGDGFVSLKTMKVPTFAHWSTFFEEQCQQNCLENCSCVAYSFYPGFGCMTWSENLIDLQKLSSGGAVLHIRLDNSELDKKNVKVVVTVAVITGVIVVLICASLVARWKANLREQITKLLHKRKANHSISDANQHKENINQVKLVELSVFSLEELDAATNNFSLDNRLGEGGFGPVYKGTLPDGQEIAVKRLSRASGQGIEEFLNEVELISKLQHRNLVRLLGCSFEGEEKILVYEHMPNKSLDLFLFDLRKKILMDWRKRLNIVEGICRGLLYLHRDSRLKIIHRDLKASNILLDQELEPKISDFGMARIFGGNGDQANTKRVVGTYGYMAPEYAMEGRFSEKSDVFSLGVLLLEIVSSRRNTSFHENDESLCLIGIAWKLWNEDNISSLVDPVLAYPCYQVEIVRCIHVGLLCVQEFAKDRPTVSTVISMLNSETVDLPIPKQPAYSQSHASLDSDVSQFSQVKYSTNTMSFSAIGGR